jgi:hypothetical protein
MALDLRDFGNVSGSQPYMFSPTQFHGVLVTDLDTLRGRFPNALVECSGYSAQLDGGGGVFRWNEGSAAATDGGLIVGSTVYGRWNRVYYGDVDVRWFGADPSGVSNSTTAIQSAINSGKGVVFPAGSYLCSALTQAVDSQRIYCPSGIAILAKNANGALMTAAGDDIEFNRIRFYGNGYTGDGVVCSGNGAQLIECASDNMSGRAAIMTGENTSVVGCCGSYATTDATATGYDIEIGLTGTVRLYGKIDGIRTNQATGGIKLIDTGAWTVCNSQIGKLTWANPSGGAGAGPGRTVNNRIVGNVSVQGSNGTFSANQFAAVTITFEAGSGFNTLDASNNTTAATIVDNGNNLVVGYSAVTARKMRVGASTSLGVIDMDTDGVLTLPGHEYLPNDKTLGLLNAAGSGNALDFSANPSDNGFIAHRGTGFMQITSAGLLQFIGASGVSCESYLLQKSNLAVTASTTQTQAAGIALALTGDIIRVSICANINDAIALPTAVAGRDVTVINNGANLLQIFPFTSDDLGAGVNASTTLLSGSSVRFLAVDATTWVVVA